MQRINNPAGVDRPEPEVLGDHRDRGTRRNRRPRWIKADPSEIEGLPRGDELHRAVEDTLPVPQDHLGRGHSKPRRMRLAGEPD